MGFWNRRKPADPAAECPGAPVQRKPRILIAGEFSAGKTQLINGLVGGPVLPSNVTATALPPVWLVRGEPSLIRVGLSGRGEPLADLNTVDLETTRYCVMAHPAPVLTGMEIIDTPGNSDPNMAAETWQRMLEFADAVVWCTNATQAWRQSEKAVWQAMPARLRQNATMVVTHADLLGSPAMADRVLQRVQREAGAFFESFLMASLLQRDDFDRIAARLRMVSGCVRLDGAPNTLIDQFAASVPVRVTTPEPATSSVATGAADPQPAPALNAQKEAGEDPDPSASPRDVVGANVLQLVRNRRPEETPPDTAPETAPLANAALVRAALAGAGIGRARSLWNEMSQSVDHSDPESLLAAVEHFIARLDAQPAQSGAVNGNSVNSGSASSAGRAGFSADFCE
ncbi:50S ribosome-binding GTPase [Pseudomonas sp. GX19020]|uniref:GTPase n=1 Tax=Pseudomonas sp. GX19020 TaxID=2942277 RepID=UPI00201963B3|nr:GTPase [Pseudomonas sp. GX19020]MCL4065971.1 50S ribosome-binding GTPase [Pseudomonas sp. GX19020]